VGGTCAPPRWVVVVVLIVLVALVHREVRPARLEWALRSAEPARDQGRRQHASCGPGGGERRFEGSGCTFGRGACSYANSPSAGRLCRRRDSLLPAGFRPHAGPARQAAHSVRQAAGRVPRVDVPPPTPGLICEHVRFPRSAALAVQPMSRFHRAGGFRKNSPGGQRTSAGAVTPVGRRSWRNACRKDPIGLSSQYVKPFSMQKARTRTWARARLGRGMAGKRWCSIW
jgi:hypothetical protein